MNKKLESAVAKAAKSIVPKSKYLFLAFSDMGEAYLMRPDDDSDMPIIEKVRNDGTDYERSALTEVQIGRLREVLNTVSQAFWDNPKHGDPGRLVKGSLSVIKVKSQIKLC